MASCKNDFLCTLLTQCLNVNSQCPKQLLLSNYICKLYIGNTGKAAFKKQLLVEHPWARGGDSPYSGLYGILGPLRVLFSGLSYIMKGCGDVSFWSVEVFKRDN